MKGLRTFGMLISVFLGLIVLISLFEKRQYNWEPTFSATDDEPFGCKLFDQMVGSSMGQRYQADDMTVTLDRLNDSLRKEPQGWLVVCDKLELTAHESPQLLQAVRRGDRVMLCTNSIGYCLDDSINAGLLGVYYKAEETEAMMKRHSEKTHIVWTGRDGRFPCDSITMATLLHYTTVMFNPKELKCTVLARNGSDTDSAPLAISIKQGKGELLLVSTPLLFTNYGMLSGNGSRYIFRLLSAFDQMPVRRVVLSTNASTRKDSALAMLDYIERQPPLWWAWCILLLLIVLFMLTNARRRQRPIPVVQAPQNHSHEFIRLIGTLYARQEGHSDLVAKKFHYTAEQLRRQLHIDITNPEEDRQSAAVIAQNSSLTADVVLQTLADVRRVLDGSMRLTELQLRQYIDRLNALSGP